MARARGGTGANRCLRARRTGRLAVPGPVRQGTRRAPGCLYRVSRARGRGKVKGQRMNSIIYLVGLVVVVMAVLSLIGLR